MTPILIGTLMMAATIAIHAVAAARWLDFVGRWHARKGPKGQDQHLFWSILWTAMVLLVLHIVEANLWAILYWNLPSHAGLSSFGQTVYFSMVSFSGLGYGDVVLSPEWGIMGPIEAMTGITVFALTTAIVIAVIQKCWKHSHGVQS